MKNFNIFYEEMVAGDSGGDVGNVASGTTTGPITGPGPKGLKPKHMKKKLSEVSKYDNHNGKPDGDNDENNDKMERRPTMHDGGETRPEHRGNEHESEERRRELRPSDQRKRPSAETNPGSKRDVNAREAPVKRIKPKKL